VGLRKFRGSKPKGGGYTNVSVISSESRYKEKRLNPDTLEVNVVEVAHRPYFCAALGRPFSKQCSTSNI